MDIEEQIRAKQDRIAQLLTAKDNAIAAVQNEIYESWNSYQRRIDALNRVGGMAANDQATVIKADQQRDFQILGTKKMQLEAQFETELNAEYKAIILLQNENKELEQIKREQEMRKIMEEIQQKREQKQRSKEQDRSM